MTTDKRIVDDVGGILDRHQKELRRAFSMTDFIIKEAFEQGRRTKGTPK